MPVPQLRYPIRRGVSQCLVEITLGDVHGAAIEEGAHQVKIERRQTAAAVHALVLVVPQGVDSIWPAIQN